MPKKSATARAGAQRNKPKVQPKAQKNIELVHPTPMTTSDEQILDTVDTDKTDKIDNDAEQTAVATSVDTMVAPKARNVSTSMGTTRTRSTNVPKVRETSARLATSTGKKEEKEAEEQKEVSEAATTATTGTSAAPKSAAARLAARRQSGQRNQLRSAVSLITAEHYSYVRRDLVFIAILAAIMFAAIIILHFVPGIGS